MRPPRKSSETTVEFPVIPFAECPAKTFSNFKDEKQLGRSVLEHCQIVGYVAQQLLELFPQKIRIIIFPDGTILIVSSHDVGKISPTFLTKLLKAVGNNSIAPILLKNVDSDTERKWGGHAGVSALALADKGKAIQTIVGQHHGFTPSIGIYNAEGEMFGGKAWQAQRKALIKRLEKEFGSTWPLTLTETQIRVISGLTCVADWIGSGKIFDDPTKPWRENISKAVANAGFVPFKLRKQLGFSDIFPFEPNETQVKLIELCDSSGIYVLEAPMGLGKTEAALYCAYKMLAQDKARGIYFALPTQLTSNKIYERFNQFLSRILHDDCDTKALLLHSNAWLENTQMGEEGQPGKSWFNSAKRGLLAPFAVGTLDQALMAVMNVKHGFVRAFGLAGKVVVLDEVHSYDTYTSEILDKLITELKEMQCTVIILSATLNKVRREKLLNVKPQENGYPLITKITTIFHETDLSHLYQDKKTHTNIQIRCIDSHSLALEEAIKRAEMGQQVLWIENTVDEAQERYLDFAARCHELNLASGLLHARFTANNRQYNENIWVNVLGKQGWEIRTEKGRIIVGTQVLEQSLDIDADFIITRFAPTDMLLQRLGRLWRHLNTPRHPSAKCEAWFLAPKLEKAIQSPREAFGASAAVYSEYILCRSLEAWIDLLSQRSTISLPLDIRLLIDATYAERNEVDKMQEYKNSLLYGQRNKKGVKALEQSARLAISKAGSTESDLNVKTRYSEEDSSEILLLDALDIDPNHQQTILILLDGEQVILPWHKSKLTAAEWRKLSAKISKETVPCRSSKLPNTLSIERCKALGFGNIFYLGDPRFNEDVPFAIAIRQVSGKLVGFEQALSESFNYHYRQDIGLQISKITNKD